MGYICRKNTLLQLKHYMQRIYLTLLSTAMKIHQIPYVIFETISHFSQHNSSVFFQLKYYTFDKNTPSNCKFFTARVKIYQISHVIFQTKSDFFFKAWITLQCHERELFCTFLAETLYAVSKSSTSKCKFSDLPLLALKSTKFVVSFLESRADFSSNFASLFSVMRDNSSVFFHPKLYMLSTKRTHQHTIFRLQHALMKVHTIPHGSFEATQSRFIQIFHHCSLHER